MNDDTRFDPVDDELRRRFADGGSSAGDPDAVLDTMRPRLQQARTRRRAAFAGAAATVAVLVVALSFALSGGGGGSVRTPPATHSSVPLPDPSVVTTTPTGTPTTVDDHGGDTGTSSDGSTAGSGSSSGETAGSGGSSGAGGSAEVPATTPSPAPGEQSYSSAGGSITVVLTNGQVSLVSNSPAAGYTAEIQDNGPDRVEVRFNNGQTEWRIRVDVVDGALQSEITQHQN